MKAKTIKVVLQKEINKWIDSIENPSVQALVKRDTIVTGGAIASMLLNEPVNDYDIYFKTKETTVAVAKYYIARFNTAKKNGIPCKISVDASASDRVKIVVKSAGIASEDGTEKAYEYFESRPADDAGAFVGELMSDPGEIEDTYTQEEDAALAVDDERGKYRPIFLSTNAITLSNRIQVVLRFFGPPAEIHKNYDFVHCTNYWTTQERDLVLHPRALEALLAKELVYVGSKYPVCSIFRLRKFIRRGWQVNAGQLLKVMMQISALDLTNIEVLQDQLTGVDCAYFSQVIHLLKDKDPTKVNTAYLIEIVERMF